MIERHQMRWSTLEALHELAHTVHFRRVSRAVRWRMGPVFNKKAGR
jgi:hypothetical protein